MSDDTFSPNNRDLLKCKLGGSHTTIIGERQGKKLLGIISQHPEIKKIIPSVIKVKGKGASGGLLNVKILRSDNRGNLRALLSQGTTAQELRIITTVGNVMEGERIRKELNSILFDE